MKSFHRIPSSLEITFSFFGLLVMADVFENYFRFANIFEGEMVARGNLPQQIVVGFISLIALSLLIIRRREAFALLRQNKILVLLIVIILASAIWAERPSVSLRRSLALFGTTSFAVYLAVRFRPEYLLKLVACALAIAAVLSLVYALLIPDVGVSLEFDGAWQGSFGHKNRLGRIMVLGALVFWVLATIDRRNLLVIWPCLILCTFLVFMSESRTSWVAAFLLIITYPLLTSLRRTYKILSVRMFMVILFGFGSICFLMFNFYEVALALLERDVSLTGRVRIWDYAFEKGSERPWLGHGYRSFWTVLDDRKAREFGHGHNSFLDIWLELGILGLGVVAYVLLINIWRAISRLVSSGDPLGIWYVMFMIYVLIFSMTSQVFPEHSSITWVLFVASLLYLPPHAESKQHKISYAGRAPA